MKNLLFYINFAISLTVFLPLMVQGKELDKASEPFYIEEIPLEEGLQQYLYEVSREYSISPFLILAIIEKESAFQADAENGDCKGLMQVSEKWHTERLQKLGGEDFFDPKDNLLCGVDYLAELFEKYEDPGLVVMLYNMKASSAKKLYKQGVLSPYAKRILERAEELENVYYTGEKTTILL